MRILGLLINLVPYHVARWHAVSAQQGCDVSVVQLRTKDEFGVLEAGSVGLSFHVETLGIQKVIPPHELRSMMTEVVERLAPDVVVICGYSFPISLAMLLAAGQRGIPVVVCSESNRDDFKRSWWKEFAKRRVIRLCRSGLVGGTPQKEYLKELGLLEDRIFTGYNAVNNEHFAVGADRARRNASQLQGETGVPDRYLLAVARFTEKKNLIGLVAAYRRFVERADASAPHLVILGDGPLRAALEQQIRELDLSFRVHLPGAIGYDRLPNYYGLAAAFIHASSTEQWGLVVNEAMASGLPILVSRRCGCAWDLVREGANGRSFDPESQEDIVSAMEWFNALPPSTAEAAGALSRAIVAAWSPEAFAVNLVKAAEAAISAGPQAIGLCDEGLLRLLMRREERA